MSSRKGYDSPVYRRAKQLEAKRLGLPAPQYVPQPAPSKPLSPEYRRAKQLEAQSLGLPAPRFDRGGREIPALAAATTVGFDIYPGSALKRTDTPAAPTVAQSPANPAPDRQLTS
jgi:hypothetical protein